MKGVAYFELLQSLDEFGARLDVHEQAARLYRLITPLLGRVEREAGDGTVLSNQEVVRELGRAAAGEPVDADAIHDHLTTMGVGYCEEQDPESLVVAQSALAAAAWLRLLARRELDVDDRVGDDWDVLPQNAPSVFTQVIDLMAWTRSDQIYAHWEEDFTDPDMGDLSAATRELQTIYLEITT